MSITYAPRIERADLRTNPDTRFVFGDNYMRKGLGGQAKEMRGEPNAIGIATKWAPSRHASAFFNDARFDFNAGIIDRDLALIEQALTSGRTIVFPMSGIGTGRASLEDEAPRTWAHLNAGLLKFGIQNPPSV